MIENDQPNWQLNTNSDINAYKSLLNTARFQGKVS